MLATSIRNQIAQKKNMSTIHNIKQQTAKKKNSFDSKNLKIITNFTENFLMLSCNYSKRKK